MIKMMLLHVMELYVTVSIVLVEPVGLIHCLCVDVDDGQYENRWNS